MDKKSVSKVSLLSSNIRKALEDVSCSWILIDLPSDEAAISFLEKVHNFVFFASRIVCNCHIDCR